MQPALPATCAVCHRSANGIIRFLDFQASVDVYGAIVICEDCAREMLTTLDYTPIERVEELQVRLEVTQNKLDAERVENERLRNAIDALFIVRPDLCSDTLPDIVDSENSESDDSGFEKSEQRTDESTSESRLENIFEPPTSGKSKF